MFPGECKGEIGWARVWASVSCNWNSFRCTDPRSSAPLRNIIRTSGASTDSPSRSRHTHSHTHTPHHSGPIVAFARITFISLSRGCSFAPLGRPSCARCRDGTDKHSAAVGAVWRTRKPAARPGHAAPAHGLALPPGPHPNHHRLQSRMVRLEVINPLGPPKSHFFPFSPNQSPSSSTPCDSLFFFSIKQPSDVVFGLTTAV